MKVLKVRKGCSYCDYCENLSLCLPTLESAVVLKKYKSPLTFSYEGKAQLAHLPYFSLQKDKVKVIATLRDTNLINLDSKNVNYGDHESTLVLVFPLLVTV